MNFKQNIQDIWEKEGVSRNWRVWVKINWGNLDYLSEEF